MRVRECTMEHRRTGEGMHVTNHVDRVLLPLVVAAALLIPGCRSGGADGPEAADPPAASE